MGIIKHSFLIIVLTVTACALASEYNVGVKNNSKTDIEGVKVEFYKSQSWEGRIMPGIIMPGTYKIQMDVDLAIPETVTVKWRKEDDQEFKEEVELKGIVPKNFKGTIWFEIGDNDKVNVIVKAKPSS